MSLTLLLGGARSGKSALATRLAAESGGAVVVIATAEPRDEEMAERIRRHRAERPAAWRTVEEPIDVSGALRAAGGEVVVVVDCLTLWVANLIERGDTDDAVHDAADQGAALAAARRGHTFVVSNEVGMGIVPTNPLARRYADLLGRVNTIWAAAADRALLVVAGRVLPLGDPSSISP